MPESTTAIVGAFGAVLACVPHSARTPEAVGQTCSDDGSAVSRTGESGVTVSPGMRARKVIFFALSVTATLSTNLYRPRRLSPARSVLDPCLKAPAALESPSTLWMITLTSSFGLDSAFASRLGAMKVDGEAFFASFDELLSATAAIGAASATSAIVIRSRPRPPLPQRAFERDSPPRFPVPHSALERVPLGASRSFRAIPSPFSERSSGRRYSQRRPPQASETERNVGPCEGRLIPRRGDEPRAARDFPFSSDTAVRRAGARSLGSPGCDPACRSLPGLRLPAPQARCRG